MNITTPSSIATPTRLFSALLSSLLLFSAPLSAQEDSNASDGGLKVGVVDIREVYRSYDRTEKFSKTFVEKKNKAQEKMKSLEEEMKQIQKELNSLEPLSDLWKKRAKKYYQLESEKKLMEDLWKQDTKQMLGRTTADIYDTIRKVIQDYADKNGYDVILKVNQSDIKKQEMSRVNEQIATRSVLYFRKSMDLTDKMITILNEQYRKKNGGDNSDGASDADSGE